MSLKEAGAIGRVNWVKKVEMEREDGRGEDDLVLMTSVGHRSRKLRHPLHP